MSEGALIAPRLYAFFHKNKNFYFGDVPKSANKLLCNYLSFSEYYENWEGLVCSKGEHKYLLSTNWVLVHALLEDLQLQGRNIEVPEKSSLTFEVGYFQNWKFKIKQSLLSLIETDYQALVEKYINQVFSHPVSKLNYKLIHPEEIKNKYKIYPTLSGARTLYSFLNRKLEILPLFSDKQGSNNETYNGWPIDRLGDKSSFIYNDEWISSVERDFPTLFKTPNFIAPKLPNIFENKK